MFKFIFYNHVENYWSSLDIEDPPDYRKGIRTSTPTYFPISIHSTVEVIGDELFRAFDSEPVSSRYKSKMNERRRILLQEQEDEDTEVIFWDEHTRPEDIMQGKDLEDYYAVERMYARKDSSSTDAQQLKRFNELSKVLEIDPAEVPGYKTFFQNGESFSSGIPDNVDFAFKYFDKFIQDHPELQQVFYQWQNKISQLSRMEVEKLSAAEFDKLTKCPEVILKHVEPKYRSLFEVHRSDFIAQDSKTSSKVKKQKCPPLPPSLKEEKDPEKCPSQQEGQVCR